MISVIERADLVSPNLEFDGRAPSIVRKGKPKRKKKEGTGGRRKRQVRAKSGTSEHESATRRQGGEGAVTLNSV